MNLRKIMLWGIIVFASFVYGVESFWPGKTMSTDQVESRWGKRTLDVNKFRDGSAEIRASMAYDLLMKQKQFAGKMLSEIKRDFGEYDGHYFRDGIPAYIIQEGQKKGEETWQIVFLPDRARKVSKIIVHKNCCD